MEKDRELSRSVSSRGLKTAALLLVLAGAGLLVAQDGAPFVGRPKPPAAPSQDLVYVLPQADAETQRIEQALDRRVDISVRDMTFQDVLLTYFQKTHGLNIAPRWGSIQQASPNIKTNTISLDLKQISLRSLLRIVLREAGRNEVSLAYIIANDAILIDTQERLEETTVTRIYDCSELLALVAKKGSANRLQPVTAMNRPTPMDVDEESVDTDTGLYADEDSQEDRCDEVMTRSENIARLQDVITQTVARDSWYPNGTASVNERDGALVITQTPTNHRQIQALLEDLKRMQIHQHRNEPILVQAWWIHGDKVPAGTLSQLLAKGPNLTADDLAKLPLLGTAVARGTNGQTLSLSSGQGRLLVTGMDPVVSEGATAFTPIVQNIFFGCQLTLTARITHQPGLVSVKFYNIVSKLKDVPEKSVEMPTTQPAVVAIKLDQPNYTAEELTARSTIPMGRPVFLGGFSSLQGADPKDPAAMPLLLFLQITPE